MQQLDEIYREARRRLRRKPAFILRRRERAIVKQPQPTPSELAELAAIRRVLAARRRR